MPSEHFTEPEPSRDDWVDVRMQDPDQGEWELDAVVVDGRVEHVDLRLRPAVLRSFVGCLVDDLGSEAAREVLTSLADREGIELATGEAPDEETDDGADQNPAIED